MVQIVGTLEQWIRKTDRRLGLLEQQRRKGVTSPALLAARLGAPVSLAPGTVLRDNQDGTFTVVAQDSPDAEA